MSNEISSNEEVLLVLITAGDERAFSALFHLHKNKVYSTAFKITQCNHLAQEIVQDVFLKIWLKRADLNKIENFSAYLCTVTKNHVYKVLKQLAHNYKTDLLTEEPQTAAANYIPDPILEKESQLILQTAIHRLPPQQKEVYHLIKNLGFKREQAAQLLHLKPETIKFHLARAQKNIRVFCLKYQNLFLSLTIYIWHK